jgi:hypothetical protein
MNLYNAARMMVLVGMLTPGCADESDDGDTAANTEGAATATGDQCEEAPDYSNICDECAQLLYACYAPPCDSFEYDPNECAQTTLSFAEECECAEMGSSTGGGLPPVTGTETGTDSTGTDSTGTDSTGTDSTGTDSTGTDSTGTDSTDSTG